MTSLLGVPSFNSCLFELSSFRATLCISSLFRRTFCIPGLLELAYSHVISPGNHLVMAMQKTSNWEEFPKAVNLGSRTGSWYDRNPGPGMVNIGGRTSGPCKIWLTGYLCRLMRRSRSRKLQHQFFRRGGSQLVYNPHTIDTKTRTHASRVAFPSHMFASITVEYPDLPSSMMLLHLSAIWWQELESAFRIKCKRSSRALVAQPMKYGNKLLASTRPNAGAIALL